MTDDRRVVYGGMLEEVVGEGRGLPAPSLDGLAERVAKGHEELSRKRSAAEVGFFDVPSERELLPRVLETAADLRSRFENLLVLGIGGSALGTTALVRALTPTFSTKSNALRVRCLDNVDPQWIAEALEAHPPERTAFAVVSKSGRTPETLSQYLVVKDALRRRFGDAWSRHLVFVTDPERGPLREEADRTGAPSFPIPANVGGRFSVFTPVGLFPAACAGIDVEALLEGAARAGRVADTPDLQESPAYLLAALLHLADRELGLENHVLMPYRQGLFETAFWFRQLWAESLGKRENVGPTPIAALGATDQHSQIQLYVEGPRDKVVCFLEVERSEADVEVRGETPPGLEHLSGGSLGGLLAAELAGTRAALVDAGRPVLTIRLPVLDEERMGALLQTFMVATAMAGELYGIDAFDQPGVEAGKVNAAALLGQAGAEERARELRAAEERLLGRSVP